jgi:hypothetical protein
VTNPIIVPALMAFDQPDKSEQPELFCRARRHWSCDDEPCDHVCAKCNTTCEEHKESGCTEWVEPPPITGELGVLQGFIFKGSK